jgi:hypothetical protein
MTDAKHTPGPWVYEVIMGDDPNGDEWPEEIEVTGATGVHIHSHDLGYNDDVDDQILANARLIAAAPDLLDALQFYADRFAIDPAGDIARAAIAKAKGGAE